MRRSDLAPALIFLVVAFAGAAAIGQQEKDRKKVVPATTEELEQQIREVMQETKTPGVGVALVSRDGTLWTAGIGKADVASGKDASPATLFRIGSISKMFVSLSAMMLVEEGRLRLDGVARDLAPEIAFENRWEATDPIRVVHLLEHTTGFDDLAFREYAHNEPSPISLREGLAYDPDSRRARWRPGTRFSYCNSGPAVAAFIIEKTTGLPFEEFVRERIFAPLKMTTASYFLTDEVRLRMATLYHSDGVTPYPYWHILMRPSGAINASPAEMANFVRMLINRGSFEGATLLQPASIERMEAPATTYAAREGLRTGYGLSNYTDISNGMVFHGHDGGVEGGLASLGYLPEQGLGYVYMINSGSGKAYEEIGALIRNFLAKDLPKAALSESAEVPPGIRARYTGWYQVDSPRQELLRFLERLLGVAHVTVMEDRLTVWPLLGKTEDLVPVTERLFREKESPAATLALIENSSEGRLIQGEGQTLRQVPAALVWTQVGAGAAALVWMMTSPLFALIWLPRKLSGRMRGVEHIHVRVLPLASVLSLAAAAGILVVSKDELIFRFGNPTLWSVGFCALTVVFAGTAWLGLIRVLRVRPPRMNRFAWLHCLLASSSASVVAAYLSYWGVIGMRSWT